MSLLPMQAGKIVKKWVPSLNTEDMKIQKEETLTKKMKRSLDERHN